MKKINKTVDKEKYKKRKEKINKLLLRLKLTNLLLQCTIDQQDFFNRMYRSLEEIPYEKISHAIYQCERTIETNNNKI